MTNLPVPQRNLVDHRRQAEVVRNTAETRITVRLDLDGSGRAKLGTGIGFFDHMLDQIARHGLIDLEIEADGDLHIDGHHTVEDVGITFGQAVAKAVGDKKGLRRYGHAYVPLRSEEHTSELQSQSNLVCRLLLEKKKNNISTII